VSFLIGNPELVRNARAELRPGRLLAATAICAALSLAIGYSMAHIHSPAENFLKLVLFAQVFALTIGGGTACIHAIQREKDQNTFYYQRVTRLTPLELTLGKLFGSPALAWFVVLCLVPAGVYAAVVSRIRPSFFVAAYALLVLGSICFHAFALLLSLLVKRGGATAAVLLLLLLLGATSGDSAQQGAFYLRPVSPFYAAKLVQGSWDISE